MPHYRLLAIGLAASLTAASTARAQDVAQLLKQTRNGTVHLLFASKPGVCGDGRGSVSIRNDDNDNGNWGYNRCEPGPVRVDVVMEEGVVQGLHTYVGGNYPAPEVKIGTHAAVAYLLDLAQHADASIGKKAIFPAMLADSVEAWPQILTVARDQNVSREVRKSAIFWLGQGAGEKATAGLKSMLSDDDVEIRKSAVFALSQLRDDQSVTALIDVAKTSRDPEVRKSALFWLGQKNDPRVLALFEDILLKK